MTMSPNVRKSLLVLHITFSVGWLGAVTVFFTLSILGMTGQNPEVLRGIYLSMNLTAKFVIVPMSLVTLMIGLIQSLGTECGLFRHYWVLVKFLLTIFATVVLLLKMKLIGYVAKVALETTLSCTDLLQERTQLMVHSGGGFLVLLFITALSVFKPWGRTGLWRPVRVSTPPVLPRLENGMTFKTKIFLVIVGIISAGFLLLHIIGGGLGHH